MKFAQILDNVMRERGISNYEMSKKTGISDSLIGYWRRGERVPKADNLLSVSNFLELSVDYLLGRTDEPQICTNNSVKTGDINGNHSGNFTIGTPAQEKQNDTISQEFMKIFDNLDFLEKMEIMNAVIAKTKMKENE